MVRTLDILVVGSVLSLLSVPAPASPPSLAIVVGQTSAGGLPSVPASGGQPSHVIVVDAAGGGSFLRIQDAVDAARDGDTILVRPGSYDGFTVVDKALVIVGDGSNVHVSGTARAQDLQPGKILTLAQLQVTSLAGASALSLSYDSGHARAYRCSFVGSHGSVPGLRDGGDGAVLDHCADVAFSHCIVRGGNAQPGNVDMPGSEPGIAGRGIGAVSSTVTIHESTIAGGAGDDGDSADWDGGAGNDACDLSESTLYAEADSFTGGNGGSAQFTYCLGGYGGWAGQAVIAGSGSLARMLRNTEVGGIPGCDQGPLCSADCYPQLPARYGATFVDLPGWAAFLDVPTPVRENAALQITARGRQGDAVYLIRSGTTRAAFLPERRSMSLVRPWRSDEILFLGFLPGNDVPVTYTLPLSDLGPGVESRTTYFQLMLDGPSDPPRLGGVSALVLLDSAF